MHSNSLLEYKDKDINSINMYYRRKTLLYLLKAFGGSLSKTDFQKLMFLLNQKNEQKHYSFFPYKYGGFSYVLNDDFQQLERLGYLKIGDRIILQKKGFDCQVKKEEYKHISDLKIEIASLRGTKLVEKIYKEFPYYAINSEIADKFLGFEELNHLQKNLPKNKTLLTLGYEGISIDAYLNKLIKNNIKVLIDVRKNPISRKYGFSKQKLSTYVNRLGITYVHLPELGISSDLRKTLGNKETYGALFKHYEELILPEQQEALKIILDILDANKRVALTCFEAEHSMCHRHKITDFLSSDNFTTPIVHLT